MRRQLVALALVAVALAFALFSTRDVLAQATRTSARNQIDFLAFYCAGKVSASRADPYLAEPLRSCEEAAVSSLGFKMQRYLVVPAPLPPFVLAPFALFGVLGYRIAATVWFVLLFVAFSVTLVLLRRLSGLPPLAIFVPLLLADALASILIGQIVPLVLCAVCAAALALRAEKPLAAAVLAAATLAEANLGLPLCVALFAWEPRARRPLLVCGALLGLLSLAYGGFALNLEYLTRVVPAQARAEGLAFGGQYSLSALLAQLGLAPELSLKLGTLSYVVMATVGIVLAARLARALRDPAFVALVPPAFALLGGAYAHIHQMAFALPLAFMFVARRSAWRPLAFVALFLLAVPWQTFAEMPFVYSRLPRPPHVDVRPAMRELAGGERLAEDEWGLWETLSVRDRRTPAQRFETKLPTWLGLIALTIAAFGLAASGGDQDVPSARASRAILRPITRA